MSKDIFEYKIRKGLLKPATITKIRGIFGNWATIIDQFCIYDDGEDAPYWHNERATLSTFSGAIFRTGELALEELPCQKKSNLGRADLWFSCGKDHFICEAKRVFFNSKKRSETIVTKSSQAVKDTKDDFPYSIPLTLTFWMPSISEEILEERNLEKEIYAILKVVHEMFQEKNIDMFCLVAPKSAHNLSYDGAYYPCVVLLGKIVK